MAFAEICINLESYNKVRRVDTHKNQREDMVDKESSLRLNSIFNNPFKGYRKNRELLFRLYLGKGMRLKTEGGWRH